MYVGPLHMFLAIIGHRCIRLSASESRVNYEIILASSARGMIISVFRSSVDGMSTSQRAKSCLTPRSHGVQCLTHTSYSKWLTALARAVGRTASQVQLYLFASNRLDGSKNPHTSYPIPYFSFAGNNHFFRAVFVSSFSAILVRLLLHLRS